MEQADHSMWIIKLLKLQKRFLAFGYEQYEFIVQMSKKPITEYVMKQNSKLIKYTLTSITQRIGIVSFRLSSDLRLQGWGQDSR